MTAYRSYIGGTDIQWWAGVGRTYTRKTSTGGQLTLNRVGSLVDVLEVYGQGTAYTDTPISTALGRIGSSNVGLLLQPGTWNIQNDLTIPANTPLYLMPGAVISVASGKTLTVNSQPEAGPYQVFAGSGSFTFATGLRLLSSWFASFSTAITKIDSATVTLEITEAETISADTTVGTNTLLLWLTRNALTVAAGKTLTLNYCEIVAGPYEIFSGSGIIAGNPQAIKFGPWVAGTLTDNATWSLAVVGTITGASLKFSGNISTDEIVEYSTGVGVEIDGVKLKDSIPYCDTITEKTATAGVTVDGCLIKDGGAAALTDQGASGVIKCKIINIGDWDMDATASVAIAHGLTYANIRAVFASIKTDSGVTTYDINQNTAGNGGSLNWDSLNINISREAAGIFDSVNFDSTSYNRGWITVLYVV